MNDLPNQPFGQLPEDQMLRINRLCNRFEAQCSQNPAVRIESVLSECAESDRSAALAELLPLETEYRIRRGDQPQQTELCQRFPDLDPTWIQQMLKLVQQQLTGDANSYGVRQRADHAPKTISAVSEGTSLDNQGQRQLGDYRIIEHLGSGGMGDVYKAVHERMGRIVALKVLRPEIQQHPELCQRFDREVRAAARLNHPNIVAAFDARQFNDQHFLITEFVDGPDLNSIVRRDGPMTVLQAADAVLQVARGLEFAHRRGVIHRDIKPGNLLKNANGVVKILDMGLARLEPTRTTDEIDLTSTGLIMGTAAYMAPEQARNTRNADARSDIYSLGCTLYFLLHGRPPFSGQSAMDVIMAHCQQSLPSLIGNRSDVPPELDRLFQRMMAKNPDDRFQTAGELVASLQDFMQPRTNSSGRRGSRKPPQKSSTPRALAATIAGRAFSNRPGLTGSFLAVTALTVTLLLIRPWEPEPTPSPATGMDPTPESGSGPASGPASGPTPGSVGPTGLRFNGLSAFVHLPQLVPQAGQSYTLEAIVQPRSIRTSNVISWLGPDWMAIYLSGNGRWGLARRMNGQSYLVAATESVVLNRTLHLAGVFDGSSLILFVDGQPVATQLAAFELPETQGGLFVGGVSPERLPADQNDRFFDGVIQEVRISTGVRYQQGFRPPAVLQPDETTLAAMSFGEGAGTTTSSRGQVAGTARIVNAEWLTAEPAGMP